ncbi:MAG: malonate decarboxylase holo-[acyl-carrier-protein] synthase [Legionella sp. 21-45-4]|nr:MAG: malonate decarboxylase holo-[acyl-carrier-protein] synthase [Legionella sp. 21-45-4]
MTGLRHGLAHVTPNVPVELISWHGDAQEAVMQATASWLEQRLPCVVTRQSGVPANQVQLGVSVIVAMPKSAQIQRAAFRVPTPCIEAVEPLPPLSQFTSLLGNAMSSISFGDSCGVYGSFLFQYVSGYTYTHAQSDVDVLLAYRDDSMLNLRQAMHALQQATSRMIDGEVRFDSCGDIAFAELFNEGFSEVLVKTKTEPYLLSREALYARFPSLQKA